MTNPQKTAQEHPSHSPVREDYLQCIHLQRTPGKVYLPSEVLTLDNMTDRKPECPSQMGIPIRDDKVKIDPSTKVYTVRDIMRTKRRNRLICLEVPTIQEDRGHLFENIRSLSRNSGDKRQ